VDERHLAVMREAMRQAGADGTANQAQVPGVTIAGKTGTAEFGSRLGAGSVYGKYKEHGWFTAFGPFENPEIAVVVFHEQGGGALTAAPTAGRILKAYFDLREQRQANGR
jgi:cell division protein FtsI/penicillin-binding protein 2